MNHYYEDVKGLGNVAVSRHAQDQMRAFEITEEEFERVLLQPIQSDVREGFDIVWRERGGIRLIILLKPEPFRGAVLVKTMFRIKAQEITKR